MADDGLLERVHTGLLPPLFVFSLGLLSTVAPLVAPVLAVLVTLVESRLLEVATEELRALPSQSGSVCSSRSPW